MCVSGTDQATLGDVAKGPGLAEWSWEGAWRSNPNTCEYWLAGGCGLEKPLPAPQVGEAS
jgi:hypothetical protein